MITVIHNKNRVYNWVRKWQSIQIKKDELKDYELAWFTILKSITKKQNILKDNIECKRTDEECKKILDHAWIKYHERLWVVKLNVLVDKYEAEKDNWWDDSIVKNIDDFKKQLIDEAIITAEELKGKKDNEIMQIATDNWLI